MKIYKTITGEDKDLNRIVQLVEIIRRYESLVEYLLESNIVIDENFDYHEEMTRHRQKILTEALRITDGNTKEAARRIKTTHSLFYHEHTTRKYSGLKKDIIIK